MAESIKESDIQRAICDYLALKRYFFWRQNTTPTFDWKTKQFRSMPKYARKGVPDIILVNGGQFIGIEVKREKGALSLEQKQFKADTELHGGTYIVARSIEDVMRAGL